LCSLGDSPRQLRPRPLERTGRIFGLFALDYSLGRAARINRVHMREIRGNAKNIRALLGGVFGDN